ncbi:hypothetical protein [Novosphingobium sp. BL-52-GroH]|uniref:hypothetical protein n=1 Tax=Novosphingobium sp. BL-52-GroH TaxID=3349877 RepID=UPI00384E1450
MVALGHGEIATALARLRQTAQGAGGQCGSALVLVASGQFVSLRVLADRPGLPAVTDQADDLDHARVLRFRTDCGGGEQQCRAGDPPGAACAGHQEPIALRRAMLPSSAWAISLLGSYCSDWV